ncbi:MAG: hypothetical protein HZY73_12405 [Micropruina sp.]|nr:MAG: hypothetical protein HZY73_12405 [Micropruina sp.]
MVDVPGCFLIGLTDNDYFATSPGALASLAEKKLTSPHAGALTKTLVEIADQVVIADQKCELPDTLRSPSPANPRTGCAQPATDRIQARTSHSRRAAGWESWQGC